MRRVMHQGELFGTIHLDTLPDKTHLYGLGPLEYLKGEILIADGISYVSSVENDSVMDIKETYDVKAPFFVYSNVENWFEKQVPDSVQTIKQLELFLNETTQKMQRPFVFRIVGEVDSSSVHIVNLPDGSVVHSPDDAHREQQVYSIENSEVEIIGFFSTEHAGVFTHHDSFVHMHLITADKKQMGHVDFLKLTPGKFKLYLPEKITH
ncbi:MAG: acetolactate decarboxylase [Bacteroidetes bacterium]|nr:acetolactate decarboxylase [Bacteroidota bacterium]